MKDFSIQSFKSTTPYPKPLNELVFRSADSFQPANPVEALKLKELARGKRKERQFMMKLHRQYELDNMKRLGGTGDPDGPSFVLGLQKRILKKSSSSPLLLINRSLPARQRDVGLLTSNQSFGGQSG